MLYLGRFVPATKQKVLYIMVNKEVNNSLKNNRSKLTIASASHPYYAIYTKNFIYVVNNDFLTFYSRHLNKWEYCYFIEAIDNL